MIPRAALKLVPWRLVGYGALLAAIIGGVLWYRHSLLSAGRARANAVWQGKWDARETALQKAANDQIQRNIVQEAASRARNEELANAHRKDLAAAAADRDRYYGLLQRARTAPASGCVRPSNSGVSGTAPASEAGGAESAEDAAYRKRLDAIDAAIADVMAEAEANASQLDTLILQVGSQL